MGDAADDAAALAEEEYFEYLDGVDRAAKLTNPELVEQVELVYAEAHLIDYATSLWNTLDEKQTSMALGISVWFRDKGFLTVKQRNALISIVAMLWTE